MLRRLGLVGKADAETENGVHDEVRESAILAPPVDPHRQTRFYKVVYRGKIGVRLTPTRPAPEDGQSFSWGDVIEVCGLAVAVPEGVLVEVKQPQGGWVFQRHGSQTLLEEVEPLKVEEGQWWYRVVHPAGAHFVKIPALPPKAPRHITPVPQGTVVHACRRHTPPGSSVTFVELSNNKGWVVESAADGSVLERAADGKAVIENVTGEYHDESEAWYRVVANPGVELLGAPSLEGPGLSEMYLMGKTFAVSERLQPLEQDWAYLKIKDRDAWVRQSKEGEAELCEKLPPPLDEVVEKWYRVQYPGGVRLRASPWFEHTHPSLGVLVCGWVFLVTRRYRAPGSSYMFLQVATPEGVVRDVPESDAGTEVENGHVDGGRGNGHVGVNGTPRGRGGAAQLESGWVPSSSNGVEVVTETTEPWIEKGLFAYQAVSSDSLAVREGPHENAPVVPQQLPAYSVVAVVTFLETGSGEEGYVQLASTGGWVLARRGQDVKMQRLPDFPVVDKTPRKFVVSAVEGVEAVVGPSMTAPGTGNVLSCGTEGRSEMVWTVKGWPGDRGHGGTRFVLLEEMGWVRLKVSRRGGQVQERGDDVSDADSVEEGVGEFEQGNEILREVDVSLPPPEASPLALVAPEGSS